MTTKTKRAVEEVAIDARELKRLRRYEQAIHAAHNGYDRKMRRAGMARKPASPAAAIRDLLEEATAEGTSTTLVELFSFLREQDQRGKRTPILADPENASVKEILKNVIADWTRSICLPVMLVYGGRDFKDRTLVHETLTGAKKHHQFFGLVHGSAPGADSLADEWARNTGLPVVRVPPNFTFHGLAGGPIRNGSMLQLLNVAVAVEFPGGRGTEDMRKRVQAANIPLIQVFGRMLPAKPKPKPSKKPAMPKESNSG